EAAGSGLRGSTILPAVPFNRDTSVAETGSGDMSPYSVTLLSGFLAVVSVNIVIAFYIYLAMKEPSDKHEPDPKFVSEAEASVKHLGVPSQTQEPSSSSHNKEE
ncbi:vacuolar ATPase assembly integral membrane protein VMA21-like domain-containing protein, partial [Tanacetum coccineum]